MKSLLSLATIVFLLSNTAILAQDCCASPAVDTGDTKPNIEIESPNQVRDPRLSVLYVDEIKVPKLDNNFEMKLIQ